MSSTIVSSGIASSGIASSGIASSAWKWTRCMLDISSLWFTDEKRNATSVAPSSIRYDANVRAATELDPACDEMGSGWMPPAMRWDLAGSRLR